MTDMEKMEQTQYWCPYCGDPQDSTDFIKSWRFQSPKGGKVFIAKIYKCEMCGKKFRITETRKDAETIIGVEGA